MKNNVVRTLGAAAAFSLLAFTVGSAQGANYEWITLTTSQGGHLTGGNGSGMTFDPTGSTPALKARAYATTNSDGTGNFITRTLGIYDGGLGVNSGTSGDDPNTSPNHSLDNVGKNDVILFEFANINYKPTALSIGWYNTDSDLQVWIGGNQIASSWDLSNSATHCSGGGSNACTVSEIEALGFTLITNGLDDLHSKTNGTASISTSATGRYMIVAGRFGQEQYANDYVKIDKLAATLVTPPPPGGAPEPGALGLLGLGLAALGWSRRRQAKKVT